MSSTGLFFQLGVLAIFLLGIRYIFLCNRLHRLIKKEPDRFKFLISQKWKNMWGGNMEFPYDLSGMIKFIYSKEKYGKDIDTLRFGIKKTVKYLLFFIPIFFICCVVLSSL